MYFSLRKPTATEAVETQGLLSGVERTRVYYFSEILTEEQMTAWYLASGFPKLVGFEGDSKIYKVNNDTYLISPSS